MARSAPGTFALLFLVLAASVLAATKWAYAAEPRTQQPQNFDGHAGEFTGEAEPPEEPLSLWYRRPAKEWVEALPVGNGRLGAMVFGERSFA